MKIYCITDKPELEIGLKLAGCDGTTVESEEAINDTIDEVIKNKEIGIIVVSKKIYEKSKDKIEYIRFNRNLPLITII